MLNSFAIQVCGEAEMITQDEYDRLPGFGMLSSSNDGEVLNAIVAISRIPNVHGLAWSDIPLPRKLMLTCVDPSDALDTGEDANAPKIPRRGKP